VPWRDVAGRRGRGGAGGTPAGRHRVLVTRSPAACSAQRRDPDGINRALLCGRTARGRRGSCTSRPSASARTRFATPTSPPSSARPVTSPPRNGRASAACCPTISPVAGGCRSAMVAPGSGRLLAAPRGCHLGLRRPGRPSGRQGVVAGRAGVLPVDVNASGNVREWCADRFGRIRPGERNMCGGAYLCHESYCRRYRCAAAALAPPTAAQPTSVSGWRLTCNPSTTQSAERMPDSRHAGPHPVLAA
jgi:hypothetical protein